MVTLIVVGLLLIAGAVYFYNRLNRQSQQSPIPVAPIQDEVASRHTCRIPGRIEVTFEVPEVQVRGTGRFIPGEPCPDDNSTEWNWAPLFAALGMIALLAALIIWAAGGTGTSPNTGESKFPSGSVPRPDQVDSSAKVTDNSMTNIDNSKTEITNTSVVAITNVVSKSTDSVMAAINKLNQNVTEFRQNSGANWLLAVQDRKELKAGMLGIRAELSLAREELTRALAAFQAAKKTGGNYRTELQRLDEANKAVDLLEKK